MGVPSGTAAPVVGAYKQKPLRPFLIDMSWMVCQYSRPSPVSSEKHEVTPALRWVARWSHLNGRGWHGGMGRYWTRPERLAVGSRSAKLTKSQRFMTLWRLSSYDTLLWQLAQDLQPMAPALRQFLPKEHAVVRPRPLARPGEGPAQRRS